MSLQWTLVATVLYVEIAIILLLTIPFIPAKRWQRLFKSRFLLVLSQQSQWYFGFLLFVLVMLLLDAIREMRKYSGVQPERAAHILESELQVSMRLFRAQRNFYISGFALFLSLVIRRLVTLISAQAAIDADREAALKQAQSATKVARDLVSQEEKNKKERSDASEEDQTQLTQLEAKLSLAEDEIEKLKTDKKAVLDQVKGVETEYHRLLAEHQKLLIKVGGDGDKKDD